MSQQKLIRLTCDGCGNKSTFDMEANLTEAQQREIEGWLAIVSNTKERLDFDRTSCAMNYLRQQNDTDSKIILPE